MMETKVGSEAGLTLIETLIGLTLMGMTLALLFNGLYVMGRSARAGHAQLAQNDRHRVVQTFLRREIGEAVPLSGGRGEDARLFFEGMAAQLRFFGELPAHRGGGGVHEMRLALRRDNGTAHLTLSHRNAWPERLNQAADDGAWERVSLVEDVRSLAFSYYGNFQRDFADASPTWRNSWADAGELPELVKIAVAFEDGRRWPDLVIPVRTRSPAVQAHFMVFPDSAGPGT